MRIAAVDDATFASLADAAGVLLPIEQTAAWDRFDLAVGGRTPWRCLAVYDGDAPVALLRLTRYEGRGFTYAWARHAPVWLDDAATAPAPASAPAAPAPAAPAPAASARAASARAASAPSPERERAVRDALADYLRAEAPDLTFVRLHAWHEASDLRDLLQTVTYDRTVIVDLTASEENRFAALSRSTRKKLRRVLEDDAVVVTEETADAAQDFSEFYAILEETAERDGFRAFGPAVYQAMVRELAPHARVFVARRTDTGATPDLVPGRAVSWLMAVVHGTHGVNFYSGQTAEGRATNIGVRLRWEVFGVLAAEGVATYDLMGVDSPRAPGLRGVGEFKRQFGPEVAVDGAWDLPLRPLRYRAIRAALAAKRLLRR